MFLFLIFFLLFVSFVVNIYLIPMDIRMFS